MQVHQTKQRTRAPVQAVDRAVDILYCVGAAAEPLTLSEVSRRTELDKATAHRLLQSLIARDLVARREPSGRYVPGPGVLRLGASFLGSPDLRTLARPYMERLVELSQETVGLGMLADRQHVYIAQAESPHELRWVVRIGVPVALNLGAGPRALLAYLPDRERDRILARLTFDESATNAPRNADELRRLLADIRRTGISLNYGERIGQTIAMAVPILGRGGRPLGTVVVGGPDARLTDGAIDRLRGPLLNAGVELSRQLGHTGELP